MHRRFSGRTEIFMYNQSKIYTHVKVSSKAEKTLRGGHIWVYRDEIKEINGDFNNGDIVEVYSESDRFLGSGFINTKSKIAVRIISKNRNDRFDIDFWERRVRYALSYRYSVMGKEDFNCCRLIFGEADTFPGLTVDRFDDILSVQVACLGTELIKDMLYSLIVKVLREDYSQKISAIYERNDLKVRTLEGMSEYCGFYTSGDFGQSLRSDLDGIAYITENGIKYEVDYINGQKTGFFLDQKYNRAAIRKISCGKSVLDCFTHTGSFGLNAAAAGALHVNSVDISADALKTAEHNAKMNGLDGIITYTQADVFELLSGLADKKCRDYDFIILDPPAFTKSRDTLKNAIKGYRDINTLAMRILPRGGYLATCSCSHFMTDTYFKQMLHNSAVDANVSLRQIEARTQSPDHPILWNVSETDYLKFYIFQVV